MDSDKDGFITREEVRKVYIQKKKEEGDKKSLMDILGLDDYLNLIVELCDILDINKVFILDDYFRNDFAVLAFLPAFMVMTMTTYFSKSFLQLHFHDKSFFTLNKRLTIYSRDFV